MPDEVTRDHAKRMHYAAHRMHHANTRRELRTWRQAYVDLRNRVVIGNRKLIYRAVRSFTQQSDRIEEFTAECHLTLIQAVVTFDPWVGIRFSTYAYTCIMRALSRLGKRASTDVVQGAVSLSTAAEGIPARAHKVATAHADFRLDDFLRANHPLLSKREKLVIVKRFELNEQLGNTTLEQVGAELGLSKERVRQVQATAITKLRKALGATAGQTDPRARSARSR
jgi:RNA polymerase sigma factor (sigma-70 family)